jgi:ParB family chromosome partitioning protein
MELDDQRVSELAMVENLQREDLNALEKAAAFRDYLARYGGTQEELASRLGLDRSTVANLIRLLDLPEEIHEGLRSKKVSQGHARALLGLPDDDARRAAYQRVVSEGLSVRQTEALVTTGEPTPTKTRIRKDPAEPHSTPAGGRAPHVLEIENQLHTRLGATVLIRVRGRDRGQIVIDFNSQEEFERITGMIRG